MYMKKIVFTLLLFLVAGINSAVFAQDALTKEEAKALIKERKELMKLTSNNLNKKVTKIAKDEAKALAKDGWKNRPGSLPLETQLLNYYTKAFSGSSKFPEYIKGEGTGKGNTLATASKYAEVLCRTNIVTLLQSEVTELIETEAVNVVGTASDVDSLEKMKSVAKSISSQSLNKVDIVVEMYRQQGKVTEVSLRALYDGKKARALILEEMEKESKALRDKMDKMF